MENFDDTILLNLIRFGLGDIFLSYFPKWKEHLLRVKSRFESFCSPIEKEWENLKSIENDKEYSEKAKNSSYESLLFQIRRSQNHFANVTFLIYFLDSQKFIKLWKVFEKTNN